MSLHQTAKYSDSGYAMVRVTEIKGGYLKTEKALRVHESVYNEFSKRHKPENGDIYNVQSRCIFRLYALLCIIMNFFV